jgi:hypothetical protein
VGRTGCVSGSLLPSWVAQGLPRGLYLPPPTPAMCLQVSERALALRHRLAGSQGWCSGSCTSQMGWQEGPVNPPGESSLAHRKKWLPALCPYPGAVEHHTPKSSGQTLCLHILASLLSMCGLGSQLGPRGPEWVSLLRLRLLRNLQCNSCSSQNWGVMKQGSRWAPCLL